MKATYDDYYVKENVYLSIGKYSHKNNLAIMMVCADSDWPEPFANLTVNLPDHDLPDDLAFIDTNNLRTAFDFILKYNLGELVGFGQSGFCTYPLIKFNLDEVKKYAQA